MNDLNNFLSGYKIQLKFATVYSNYQSYFLIQDIFLFIILRVTIRTLIEFSGISRISRYEIILDPYVLSYSIFISHSFIYFSFISKHSASSNTIS